jgi:hypothetical protein
MYIQRSGGGDPEKFREEKGDSSDSDKESEHDKDSDSEEEQVEKFTFEQQDPMDNLVDSHMILDYLKGTLTSPTPIAFGTHIDLHLPLKGKLYS